MLPFWCDKVETIGDLVSGWGNNNNHTTISAIHPSSPPPPLHRVPEGQIPRPRGGHTPRRHRLHSDGRQKGPGAGERRAAQLCEGEDIGQASEPSVKFMD